MRALAIAGVMMVAAVAHADTKADVEKLVRAHVAATVGKQGALVATLAEQHLLIDGDGNYMELFLDCETDPKSSACDSDVPLFGRSWFGTLAYSNVKPVIYVDDAGHSAAFYVTADLAGKLVTDGASAKGKTQMRITGIATLEKGGWKIAAAKYSASLPAPQRVGTREEPREEIRAMLPARCGSQPMTLVNNAG